MSTSDVLSCAVATYGTAYLAGGRPPLDGLAALATEVSFDGPVSWHGPVGRLGEAFDALAALGVRRLWLTRPVALAVTEPVPGRWAGAFEPLDDGGRGYAARESYAWSALPGLVPERLPLDAAAAALHAAGVTAGPPPMYRDVVPDGYPAAARDVAWLAVRALDLASRLPRDDPGRAALLDAMRGGLVAAANA